MIHAVMKRFVVLRKLILAGSDLVREGDQGSLF